MLVKYKDTTNMDHLILDGNQEAIVKCMHKGSSFQLVSAEYFNEVNKVTVNIVVIPHVQGLKLPLRCRQLGSPTSVEFGNELRQSEKILAGLAQGEG